jgi:hypothetical protein
MTYLPISEKLMSLIENLKPEDKSVEEWLELLLNELKQKEEFKNIQTKKMKELWQNDSIWDKYEV